MVWQSVRWLPKLREMPKDSVVRLGKRSLIAVLLAAADHVVQRDDGMRNHQDSLTKNIKYVVDTASCEISIFSAPAFLQIIQDLDPSLRLRKPKTIRPYYVSFSSTTLDIHPALTQPWCRRPLSTSRLRNTLLAGSSDRAFGIRAALNVCRSRTMPCCRRTAAR